MTDQEPPRPVKPAQSRDGKGTSAVFLEPASDWGAGDGQVYVKRQTAYWCRPAWRGFRRTPTLRRELRGLTACRRLGVAVPDVVVYRQEGPHAVLVLEEVTHALPLDRALAAPGADRADIVGNVAGTIGRLHRGGWTHGALYPDHILVRPGPGHEVVLIDLEKARRSRLRRASDLDRFWRHNAAHLSPPEAALFRQGYRSTLGRGATHLDR